MSAAPPGHAAALLRQAAAAWSARRHAEALALALQAWQAERAPELAAAVEALGARLAKALPRLPRRTRSAFDLAWAELAAQRRALDVERLLEPFAHPHWGKLRERVELLARFPDDPRIAAALTRLALTLPASHARGDETWAALFGLIARLGDVRTFDALHARQARGPAPRLDVAHAIEAMLMPAPALLSDEERAALAALQAALDATPAPSAATLLEPPRPRVPDGGDACLAAIYANPGDAGARLVYADWLLERGDARGDFITLQLRPEPTAAERARMAALLERHAATWLGPLAPLLPIGACTFARGFLDAAPAPQHILAEHAALVDHPAWSTLRTLDVWHADTAFLVGCELRGLETLAGTLRLAQLAAMLARPRPYPCLETLHLSLGHGAGGVTQAERRQLLEGAAMPALRRLHVNVDARADERIAPWDWIMKARGVAGVDELWVHGCEDDALLARLRAHKRPRVHAV